MNEYRLSSDRGAICPKCGSENETCSTNWSKARCEKCKHVFVVRLVVHKHYESMTESMYERQIGSEDTSE